MGAFVQHTLYISRPRGLVRCPATRRDTARQHCQCPPRQERPITIWARHGGLSMYRNVLHQSGFPPMHSCQPAGDDPAAEPPRPTQVQPVRSEERVVWLKSPMRIDTSPKTRTTPVAQALLSLGWLFVGSWSKAAAQSPARSPVARDLRARNAYACEHMFADSYAGEDASPHHAGAASDVQVAKVWVWGLVDCGGRDTPTEGVNSCCTTGATCPSPNEVDPVVQADVAPRLYCISVPPPCWTWPANRRLGARMAEPDSSQRDIPLAPMYVGFGAWRAEKTVRAQVFFVCSSACDGSVCVGAWLLQ